MKMSGLQFKAMIEMKLTNVMLMRQKRFDFYRLQKQIKNL